MNKISRLILSAFCLLTFAVNSFASVPLTRIRNFVNDASNNVPITASYMDAELNQLVAGFNNTMVVQATSPSSPFEGETWYNTTNHIVEEYRNNEWVTIGALHISATQMANPQTGDLWYNTTTKVLNAYNGSTFITISATNLFNQNVGIGTTLPIGGLDVEGTLSPTIFYGLGPGNIGIGTILPRAPLEIEVGNVGLGTIIIPGTQLDVGGTVQALSYSGQNGHGILNNFGSSITKGSVVGPVSADTWLNCSVVTNGAATGVNLYISTTNVMPVNAQSACTSTNGSNVFGCPISGFVPKGDYYEILDPSSLIQNCEIANSGS
jgi:hypothetical protein